MLALRSIRLASFVCLLLSVQACELFPAQGIATEAGLRSALRAKTGLIRLAPGVIEVSAELQIPAGAYDLEIRGDPSGSTLRAAEDFQGRAVLFFHCAERVRLTNFAIDGNRDSLEKPAGLPPAGRTFADFYGNNGVVAEQVKDFTISRLHFRRIANYAVIVNEGEDILIEQVRVEDSGSRDERGRNNASGGVLLENGTRRFIVRDSEFKNIRGNAVWTHSRYGSPRNSDGLIAGNRFENVARDAIQIGHATRVRVEGNSGSHIGFPLDDVDVEAMPVAIDTAGNTDQSAYLRNRFEEINGKCIDLDGFHHGEVRENVCINRGPAAQYPSGHFGIVMNNSNPDMQSEHIVIAGNEINGAVYGGIFIIGNDHEIVGNRLRNLNLAGCVEGSQKRRCIFWPEEPLLLRSGIYLGRGAERPAETKNNKVEGNWISGFGMAESCIAASPQINLSDNLIGDNRCSGAPAADP